MTVHFGTEVPHRDAKRGALMEVCTSGLPMQAVVFKLHRASICKVKVFRQIFGSPGHNQ